jgi:hypothetical protein
MTDQELISGVKKFINTSIFDIIVVKRTNTDQEEHNYTIEKSEITHELVDRFNKLIKEEEELNNYKILIKYWKDKDNKLIEEEEIR